MDTNLPEAVRYVKNGRGGQWWPAAKTKGQVHVGWKVVPKELLLKPDYPAIAQVLKTAFGERQGATQDFNALRDLLEKPSNYVWITFEDGYMWWCTVRDGVNVNPKGESATEGNFWLNCDRPWSNSTLAGKPLALTDLPGTVTATGGFKGTVCTPKDWQTVLRIITDQKDAAATESARLRDGYTQAVHKLVQRLSPKDFEQLVDHMFARTGWARISTLGGAREGVDLEAENAATGEIAFVQVKSAAGQDVLDDYIGRFVERRHRYARMIFAVHTPKGTLAVPGDVPGVHLWTGDWIARLVVRLGLGEWVESRFG